MRSVAVGAPGKLLRKPWYSFWRFLERAGFRGHEYGIHIPYGQRIYTPWFETNQRTDFSKVISQVQSSGRLGVALDRCYVLHQLAGSATRLHPGKPMAECGVYTGGTAQLIALTIAQNGNENADLHLFDTFEGMPETSIPERDYHNPGDFSDTSLEAVQRRLAAFPFCSFHQGFMPDTFAQVADIPEYSFVHVDVDIYPSVGACLEWFWPRLSRGGAMVFDDYGFYPYRKSARVAVDEFFADRSEKPWPLPTGQAVVFKW
jgi:hypothetical protein